MNVLMYIKMVNDVWEKAGKVQEIITNWDAKMSRNVNHNYVRHYSNEKELKKEKKRKMIEVEERKDGVIERRVEGSREKSETK